MPQRNTDRPGGATAAATNGHRAARRDRVLVVDDEENVRITTAAILEQEGYEVATASDGREALEMVARGHFDLVLTDLRMDDMDGSTLLHELQTAPPHRRHDRPDGLRLHRVVDRRAPPGRLRLPRQAVRGRRPQAHRRGARLNTASSRGSITELSSPVVEIWDGVLLVPLVGTLDDQRAAQMSTALLEAVRREGAQVVTRGHHRLHGRGHLHRRAPHQHRPLRPPARRATIITGVSAHVAADLVKLGVELEDITTRRRLADGLRLALELLHVTVQRPAAGFQQPARD